MTRPLWHPAHFERLVREVNRGERVYLVNKAISQGFGASRSSTSKYAHSLLQATHQQLLCDKSIEAAEAMRSAN